MNCESDHRLVIVILAAGRGTRFGGAKQLAIYSGQSLLKRILYAAKHTQYPTIVVAGAYFDPIRAHLSDEKVTVLRNPDWESGLSSSINTAVNYCFERYENILFVAADQIKIQTQDFLTLIQRWQLEPSKITSAWYNQHPGIPALFPKSYFSKLRSLKGDKGARALLYDNHNCNYVNIPNAAFDVDTKEDLANYHDYVHC